MTTSVQLLTHIHSYSQRLDTFSCASDAVLTDMKIHIRVMDTAMKFKNKCVKKNKKANKPFIYIQIQTSLCRFFPPVRRISTFWPRSTLWFQRNSQQQPELDPARRLMPLSAPLDLQPILSMLEVNPFLQVHRGLKCLTQGMSLMGSFCAHR